MRNAVAVTLLGCSLAAGAAAQSISPAAGADSQVDYADLARFGPWDDRNYRLTEEDLSLLSPDEAEQREAIPAFYRVELRRRNPRLPRSGPAQYPRSAYPAFLLRYGGFLYQGKFYRAVTYHDGRFHLDLGGPAEVAESGFETAEAAVVLGEVRISNPSGAAESAVAINPLDPSQVIAGSNGPLGGQGMHWSVDGGATWHSVQLPLGGSCCDPTVDWSSDGEFGYAATLGSGASGCCDVWFYRTSDGGQSWTDLEAATPGDPRREVTSTGNADKELIHVDKFPGSPFENHVYLTWHESSIVKFARSTNRGETFLPTLSLGAGSAELGLGSDLTSDKNGHVYYFWPAYNSGRILLRKSADGGASFAPTVEVAPTFAAFIFPLPVMETREVCTCVAADVDLSAGAFANTVYVAWSDTTAPESTVQNNHGRIQVAFSRDGGATWTVRTPHETADALTVDRFNPWLAVSADGLVHVVFYDTRQDLPGRNQADVYHSVSRDGGETWAVPERLTSVSSPNIADGFEWGDYNGLSAVGQELLAVFTDNRDEAGGGNPSVDVYGIGFESLTPLFADGFESGDFSAWSLCAGLGCSL